MAGELSLQLQGLGIKEPFSHEAEQAVLGAVLIEPNILAELIETLNPDHFYNRQRSQIYEQLIYLFTQSKPIDIITLVNHVTELGIIADENEAKLYFKSLADTVPTLSHFSDYAKIIVEKHTVRRLMHTATDIVEATTESTDAAMLLEMAEQRIYELRQGHDTSALQHIRVSVTETLAHVQKISGPEREKYLGVPTGFAYLDVMLGGLGKSDLVILAARPGMGKTSFALNIATNIAKRGQSAVAFFSLEMSREQLNSRILSSEAMLDSSIFRTGIKNNMQQWEELADVASEVAKLPIFLDDSSGITVPEMKAKIRRINSDPHLPSIGVIFIDYLQLMTSGRRTDNRVSEISEITRNLKIMAKELMVPIITLSQLNRASESRAKSDHRPVLADLRDSGSIEQDADSVLFLYRDSKYNETADERLAECIVSKNRHGEVGKVDLIWDGSHTRFLDPDYSHDEEY